MPGGSLAPTSGRELEDAVFQFDGAGLTENMRSYLVSSGRAVALEDLEPWLRLFFGLALT